MRNLGISRATSTSPARLRPLYTKMTTKGNSLDRVSTLLLRPSTHSIIHRLNYPSTQFCHRCSLKETRLDFLFSSDTDGRGGLSGTTDPGNGQPDVKAAEPVSTWTCTGFGQSGFSHIDGKDTTGGKGVIWSESFSDGLKNAVTEIERL